jgi:anti-anti-sigma factor
MPFYIKSVKQNAFLSCSFVFICRTCLKLKKNTLYFICKGDKMLKIDMEYVQKILFVRLTGNLNYKTSYKIENFVFPVIKKHQIKFLVYNCENLNNIDIVGIDAILYSKYLIKNNKGKIYILAKGLVSSLLKNLKIKELKSEEDAKRLVASI